MPPSIPTWQRVATLSILGLASVASLTGLLRPAIYQPELLPGFLVQDALMLLVGVPGLAIGFVFARRGSTRGRLVWLGALAYMTYLWASIALQVAFNQLFLGYVALFGLSLFTLIGGLADTDPAPVAEAVGPRVREGIYGGFLWLIALGLAALWLSELVPATLSNTPPSLVTDVGPHALASHVIDLSTVVPALAIAGTMLRRRRPWGYVFAGVGLVFGAFLAPTLTGMTAVILLEGAIRVSPVAIVFTALPALLAAALAIAYLRRLPGGMESGDTGRGPRPA
jgi:hypothetical protein